MSHIDLQKPLIDVKCFRITFPKQNLANTPLNGLYQPLDLNINEKVQTTNIKEILQVDKNEEQSSNYNKYIQLSPNGPNIDNMFYLTEGFGRILLQETLNAILIFINKPTEDINLTLQNLVVKITSEPISKESCPKQIESRLDIKENILLKPHKFYSLKLKQTLQTMGKYTIDIFSYIHFKIKEEQYSRDNYGRINRNSLEYVDRVLKREFIKKLTFESMIPFKIKESFSLLQMKKCRLEINICNSNNMPLNIFEVYLQTEKNTLVKIIPENNEKSFILQAKEELNMLFMIDNKDIYLNTPIFYLTIEWSNLFDSNRKYFKQAINNNLSVFNYSYNLYLIEAPKGNIKLKENFKLIFKIKNKTKKLLKLEISVNKTQTVNRREIEVVDIVDNILEFEDEVQFCFICRSDNLGTVCLPTIKIYNQLLNKQEILEKLLLFKCESNI